MAVATCCSSRSARPPGLRAADAELAGALRRAGADRGGGRAPRPQRDVRTLALTDLVWARAAPARRPARDRRARSRARSSTRRSRRRCCGRARARSATTRPPRRTGRDVTAVAAAAGAPAAARARRCCCRGRQGTLAEGPAAARARDRRARSRSSRRRRGRRAARDLAAVTYAANPHKKGLDRVLAAWAGGAPGRARSSSSPVRRTCPRPPGVRDVGRAGRRTTSARCCGARASTSPRRGARTTASPSSRRSPTAACS